MATSFIRIFQTQTHTHLKKLPHPTQIWRLRKFTGPIYLFGHSLAAAPGHGQVALGAKNVALGPGPPGPGLAPVQVRATFFAPSATWPWPGGAAASVLPWPGLVKHWPGNICLEMRVQYKVLKLIHLWNG